MKHLKYLRKIAVLLVFSSAIALVGCESKEDANGNTSVAPTAVISGANNSQASEVVASSIADKALSEAQETHLKEILERAKTGQVINIEFGTGRVIEDVIKKYGQPDIAPEWVSEQKGIYAGYNEPKVSFGYNKGSQIFEIKWDDPSLNEFTRGQIETYYGKPGHVTDQTNHQSVGYAINEDYRLIFTFAPSLVPSEAKVMGYSVLWPAGTVNNMAEDSGRQW